MCDDLAPLSRLCILGIILTISNEPPHIHVAVPDGECKFWLEPVRLARNKNVSPHVVREMERLVYENYDLLLRAYHEYHNQ